MAGAKQGNAATGDWSKKYGDRHQWRRVRRFPAGIKPPKKVRIYRRGDHYLLNGWDPRLRRNTTTRVEGDLVAAISAARALEERIESRRSSGVGHRRCDHAELLEQYQADLGRRADAGEIDPRSVVRYGSALAHYRRFVEDPQIAGAFPFASRSDREFALAFRAYLQSVQISPNGHAHTARRPMNATGFVESTVRSMFDWASDQDRGALLPADFRNPFNGAQRRSSDVARDPLHPPDVTVPMVLEFIGACDSFQLPMFGLLAVYGLRPSEICVLFHENFVDGWLDVRCDPELAYFTKGRRNKRLPPVPAVRKLIDAPAHADGLLFVRRQVAEGRERPALLGAGLDVVRQEFRMRCLSLPSAGAAARVRVRNEVLRVAGAVSYDLLDHEYRLVSRQLSWPKAATLKDFRHLFSTLLQNAGMPDMYRRYLMGHALGRSALVNYSHLDQIQQQFERTLETTMQPIVAAIGQRAGQL